MTATTATATATSETSTTTAGVKVVMLVDLCARLRPELACLGELGAPLIDALGVVERAGTGREVEALADPGFALDVLAQAGPGGDPAVVGRVLDLLRTRADATTATGGVTARVVRRASVTVAGAVRSYEPGPLALMAPGTQRLYGAWVRRLAGSYGARDPDEVDRRGSSGPDRGPDPQGSHRRRASPPFGALR